MASEVVVCIMNFVEIINTSYAENGDLVLKTYLLKIIIVNFDINRNNWHKILLFDLYFIIFYTILFHEEILGEPKLDISNQESIEPDRSDVVS